MDVEECPGLTGIIVAGGEGRRMGMPKAFLRLQGRSALDLIMERLRPVCDEFLISASSDIIHTFVKGFSAGGERQQSSQDLMNMIADRKAGFYPDSAPKKGPLNGLATLIHSTHPWAFVTSCDAPLVSPALVRGMLPYTEAADIVVPEHEGRLQPLQALYRREVGEAALHRLRRNRLKLMDLLKDGTFRVHTIPEAEWIGWGVPRSSFMNLNTPEDVQAASLLLNEIE